MNFFFGIAAVLWSFLVIGMQLEDQAPSHKVVFWGVNNVLLKPDIGKTILGKVAATLGYTAEQAEQDLFKALEDIPTQDTATPGSLPPIIKSWLKGRLTCKQIAAQASQQLGRFALRLHTAAAIAFDPQQSASALTPLADMLALVSSVKNKGHAVAIATNWNAQSFEALKRQHQTIFSLFSHTFISGRCGYLTTEQAFYGPLLKTYKAVNCYFVDSMQENLDVAESLGITPIFASTTQDVQRALLRYHLLEQADLAAQTP